MSWTLGAITRSASRWATRGPYLAGKGDCGYPFTATSKRDAGCFLFRSWSDRTSHHFALLLLLAWLFSTSFRSFASRYKENCAVKRRVVRCTLGRKSQAKHRSGPRRFLHSHSFRRTAMSVYSLTLLKCNTDTTEATNHISLYLTTRHKSDDCIHQFCQKDGLPTVAAISIHKHGFRARGG